MILMVTSIVLSLIMLFLMFLLWIRKKHFDDIHLNFLELQKEFGGIVQRDGFAARPKYACEIDGDKVAVNINSESSDDGRNYYIGITMDVRPKAKYVIRSTAWIDDDKLPEESNEEVAYLCDNAYVLEADRAALLKLNIGRIDSIVQKIDPFAYVLMGQSVLLLERAASDLKEETALEPMRDLINNLIALKQESE